VVLFHHLFDVLLTLLQAEVLDREYELTLGVLLDQGIFGNFMLGIQDLPVDEELE